MRLKQFVGGVGIAGALGVAALGMGAGFAGALPGHRRLRAGMAPLPRAAPAMAGRSPEISTIRPAPMTLADRAVPAGRVGPVGRLAVPAAPVIPVALVDQVDLAVPITPAAPVGRAGPITLAGRVVPAGPITPAARVVPGMGTPNVATSTAPRGATDPPPGDRVNHRVRRGIDRSLRPAGTGTTARSTTGATRRLPSGIPGSTSGASGSSECGSRCEP